MKTCPDCKINKPFSEYYVEKNKTSKDGYRYYCIVCTKRRVSLYRKKHPEKVKQSKKIYQINNKHKIQQYEKCQTDKKHFTKFGLTQEQYQGLKDRCNNKCEICYKDFIDKPNIDHNHLTGEIRGLLCKFCNSGIGFLNTDENTQLLQNAIDYINKNSKQINNIPKNILVYNAKTNEYLGTYENKKEIALKYNLSVKKIQNCLNKIFRTHKGFIFIYEGENARQDKRYSVLL